MQAKQCSDTEQTATEAERENDRWKTCLVMKTRITQRFDGRIQGFSLKAAFVRLDSPFVDVGVPLGALGGLFVVDDNRTRATGQGGALVLPIGARVRVEITGVDEDLRRVSAWMVEAQAQDAKGKLVRFVPSLAAPVGLREHESEREGAHEASPGREPASPFRGRSRESGPGRQGTRGAAPRSGGSSRGADSRPGGPSRSADSRPGGPSRGADSRSGGPSRSADAGPGGPSRGPGSRSGGPARGASTSRPGEGDPSHPREGGGRREGGPRGRAAAGRAAGRPPKPPKGSVRGMGRKGGR
jgi:hypothetical protein